MIERIELSTNAYSLDDVLTKIVDHYNSTKQIGSVEREPQVIKQSDEKDGKKKKVISYQGQIQQSAMAMLVQ
jgi:hypothetical protein